MEVSVREGQSIFDIVTQYFGEVQQLAQFMSDNRDLTLTSNLNNQQVVQVNATGLGDENNKDFYIREDQFTNNAETGTLIEQGGDFNNDYNNDYNL